MPSSCARWAAGQAPRRRSTVADAADRRLTPADGAATHPQHARSGLTSSFVPHPPMPTLNDICVPDSSCAQQRTGTEHHLAPLGLRSGHRLGEDIDFQTPRRVLPPARTGGAASLQARPLPRSRTSRLHAAGGSRAIQARRSAWQVVSLERSTEHLRSALTTSFPPPPAREEPYRRSMHPAREISVALPHADAARQRTSRPTALLVCGSDISCPISSAFESTPGRPNHPAQHSPAALSRTS